MRIGRVLRENPLAVAACVLASWAVVAALFFIFRPDRPRYTIGGANMVPTLDPGDRVQIHETTDVERGDVIVFEAPRGTRSAFVSKFVSRVIALPGETLIVESDGSLVIDDRLLTEPYIPASVVTQFPDAVPEGCGPPSGGAVGCVVPRGHVFVMGDNRIASRDSRGYGPVRIKTIVGRTT
ncbi:MAG: signal peptidase I [Dehalococcoidia bacterium]